MPKKRNGSFIKRKKRKFAKKYFKRKTKGYSLPNLVVSTSRYNPIPPIYKTVMRTNLTGVIGDLGVNGSDSYTVKLNSLVDPWFTGDAFPNPKLPTGITLQNLRPAGLNNFMGYTNEADNIQSLYTIGRVMASSIKVTIIPPSGYISTGGDLISNNCQVTVIPITNVAYNSGISAACSPYGKSRLVTAYDISPISNFVRVASFAGMTKQKMLGEDNMRFSLETDPQDLMYWQVYVEKCNSGNLAINALITYNVTVDYYLQFEEPIGASLSKLDIIATE